MESFYSHVVEGQLLVRHEFLKAQGALWCQELLGLSLLGIRHEARHAPY